MSHVIRTFDYTQKANRQPAVAPGLRRFSKLVVFATFVLIYAGSLVTSTGSGLSVPDWPNTYGHFMFTFPLSDMVGGIFYEHTHRLIASVVGLLTVILAIWIAFREKRKWVKVLGFCAVGAVILQGIFGGITVLFFLPTAVSVTHAVLAQTFFVLTIVIAYSLSKEWGLRQIETAEVPGAGWKFVFFLWGAVYLQLILGALMRHTGSGLAIPDFPTMGGSLWPSFNPGMLAFINSWRFDADLAPVTWGQVIIHLAHRVGAVIVVLAAVMAGIWALRGFSWRDRVTKTVLLIWVLVAIQFALGAFTVLSRRQYFVASFHVLTGAVLLGVCVVLVLRVLPVGRRQKTV